MRKIFLLFFLPFFAVFASQEESLIHVFSEESPSYCLKEFIQPGYKITYPVYWSLTDQSDYFLIADADRCGAIVGLVLSLLEPLDDFTDKALELLSATYNLDFIEKIESADGKEIQTYVMSEKDKTRIHRIAFCAKEGKVSMIDTFSEKEYFEKSDASLKRIIASFQFIE